MSVLIGAMIVLPARAALASTPTHKEIFRLYSPSINDHMASTNPYEAGNLGYHAESGYLYYAYPYGSASGNTPAPAHPVYRCYIWGWDHMVSTASNCEIGYGNEGALGYLLDSPRAGHAPVYRCATWGRSDHFTSTASNCEGQRVEYILGYYKVGTVGVDEILNEGTVTNACFGRCGKGCSWSALGDFYTPQCLAHDQCVQAKGQLACLPQFIPAAISWAAAAVANVVGNIINSVKSFFKRLF